MIDFDDITEADEQPPSKAVRLAALREQIRKGEPEPIIEMYERAAWDAGATRDDTSAARAYCRPPRRES